MFPPGSDQQPTAALPVIWTDQAGFKAAAEKAEGLAEKLAEAAKGGDAQATLAAFAALGKEGCGGCHETFRKKDRLRPSQAVGRSAGVGGDCSSRRRRLGPKQGRPARGELLFHIGGCTNCHTAKNGALLAGGDPIVSPFGDFHAPNITPDPETGIGGWTLEQFIRAMREGRDPEGWPLYPAFPYTSYTRMTDEDLAALKAYLDGLPAVSQASKPHDLWFPFNLRWGLYLWQWLFFTPERFQPDPAKDAVWNRGAYLVLGARTLRRVPHAADLLRRAGVGPRRSPGAQLGKEKVPNITPEPDGRARQVERRRSRHLPQARHDARRRLRRLRDGQGGQQRHQQAARRRHRRHRRLSGEPAAFLMLDAGSAVPRSARG